jgi:hypothetical protein
MISSMIDQEPGYVHILGVPNPTSMASGFVWEALASDGLIGWHRGTLRYSGDSRPDDSSAVATCAEFAANGVPSFFLDMLVSVDLEIPPAEEVMALVDPHAANISLASAAFHLPSPANIEDLAVCMVASRIAMECREYFRRPSGVTEAEMIHALHDVGLNALAIGGVAVYSAAKRLLAHPYFWKKEPNGERGIDFEGQAE